MAPRKNADGKTASIKKNQEKKPKEKVLKPKLKTPTIVKVKIPIPGSIPKNVLAMSPKITPKPPKKKQSKKALDKNDKIDLANEVAQAQLGNPKLALPKEDPVQNEDKKLPKKRGRKRKDETPQASSLDSDDVFQPSSPIKKRVRKEVLKKKKPAATKAVNVKKTKKTLKVTKKDGSPETKPKRPILKQKSPSKAADKPAKSKLSNIKGKNEDVPTDVPSPLNDEGKQPSASVEPGFIVSRKTSINSDQLSWTKDISSSSTTTCITASSTDFVRYDKKMPVVKLDTGELIAKLDTQKRFLSSSSDSSETNAPNTKPDAETPDVQCPSLDLSTSSVTSKTSYHENSLQNSVINEEITKTSKALDKLTSKLKKFDLEIINWIGYEEEGISVDMKKFQGKILQVLKEESEVIAHCQRLKKVLSDNVQPENGNDNSDVPIDEVDDVNDLKEYGVHNEDPAAPNVPTSDDGTNLTSGRVRYKSIDQSYDDDDALSLFAESITGLDTSARNSVAASVCNAAEIEEYIPKALEIDKWTATATYQPTKILNADKSNMVNDMKTKTVCEKQNADSTSIKDTEQDRLNVSEKPNVLPQIIFNPIWKVPTKNDIVNKVVKRPNLICDSYKPPPGRKSIVLKGICFFNLSNSCRKGPNVECRYRHDIPTLIEISNKLARLGEAVFIQEYMLFREWPSLRRQYGMCFVTECKRRDLTRILVEMAIDFTAKSVKNIREDDTLQIEVMELVLLHLNDVHLDTCEDLLMYSISYRGNQVLLCDLFMQVIANTQNFSRFKPVFLKLTMFSLRHKRSFRLDVATQILERLSILPCEQPLLAALLEIVKNTDMKILENQMMVHLEKQLSSNTELLEELLKLKRGMTMCRPVLNNLYQSSPRLNTEMEPLLSASLIAMEREKRYTSPDTTNLDNMNKTTQQEEAAITPTVEFNRAHLLGCIQRTFSNSNSSNDSQEFRPNVPNNNYKKWRDTSYSHLRDSSVMRQRSPLPGGMHVHQRSFERGPGLVRGTGQSLRGPNLSKFLRRSGPDFY